MDENLRKAGSIFTGILILFCAMLVAPLAIGLLASYPHELSWLGVALTGGVALMVYGGIKSIRDSLKQQQLSRVEEGQIKAALNSLSITSTQESTITSNPDIILAHWVFTNAEWEQFIILEKRRRISSTFFEALAIIILGALAIVYYRQASLITALSVSIGLAAVISGLRYLFTMHSYGATNTQAEVIITLNSAWINGKQNIFRSEKFHVKNVALIDGTPSVIEVTYEWRTRRGKTFDELRVPIPNGKREEAQQLINQLLRPST